MSGLLEMWSVDGYASGKIIKVRLDGNTNINGANGAGKTTLLRMLPIFYGVSPGDIQSKKKNKRNFVDYYLQNASSYLAFQYERGGKKLAVVLSRRPGQAESAAAYYFVEGSLRDEWFLKESSGHKEFVINSDWRSHMKEWANSISPKLGPDEYRLVIQSNHRYTKKSRLRNQVINDLRRQYAFPDKGRDMSNIHLIIDAILQREPNLNSVKHILENVLVNQGSIASTTFELPLQAKKVDDWIANRSAYLKIESQRDAIEQLEETRIEFQEGYQHLCELHGLAKKLDEHLDIEIDKLSKQFSALGDRIQSLKDSRDNENGSLSTKMRNIQAEKDAVELSKTALEKAKAAYECFDERDLTAQKALIARSPRLKEELDVLQEQLREMEDGVNDVQAFYDKQLAEIKSSFDAKASSIEKEKLEQENHFERQKGSLADVLSQEKERLAQVATTSRETFSKRENALSLLRGEVVGKLQNVTASPEMLSALKSQEAYVIECREDIAETEKDYFRAVQEEQTAKTALDKSLELSSKLGSKVKQLSEELERTKSLANPSANSLIAFLKENIPNWSCDIAKVISPELLQRVDLHPQHAENLNSLYGVQLDLSGIETPGFAKPTELDARVTELDEELAELIEQKSKLDADLVRLKKVHSEAGQAVNRELINKKAVESSLAQAQKDFEECQIQVENDQKQNKQALEADLKSAEEKLMALSQEKSDFEVKSSQQVSLASKEHEQKLQSLEAELKATLERLTNQLKTVEQRKADAISQLETERESALENKGVDVQALTRKQKEIEEALKLVNAASRARKNVEDYEAFLEQQWPAHAELQKSFDELSSQYAATENERETLFRLASETITESERQSSQCETRIKSLTEQQKNLNRLLSKMAQYPPSEGAELKVIHTPEYIAEAWSASSRQVKAKSASGNALFENVRDSFLYQPNSNPCSFYNTLRGDLQSSPLWDTNHQWSVFVPGLHSYLQEEHSSQKELLSGSARLIGQNLTDFFTQLERVNRDIRSLGRQVTEHTQQVCENFNAIDELSVKVTSDLDSEAYWPKLKEFAELHVRWMGAGNNELPDELYLRRLHDLKDILLDTGLSVSLAESFKIEVTMVDQGVTKTATKNSELKDISSNGLSYLTIILIYNALINMLRKDRTDSVVIALDELRDFDLANTVALIHQLKADNINLFTAFPEADHAVLQHFDFLYEAKGQKGSNHRQLNQFIEPPMSSVQEELEAAFIASQEVTV